MPARPNAGDDSNPRSGEGGPRKSAAQMATDPAFTGTYATRAGGTTTVVASLPFVNVRDYGAVGDGVTDDTAAVQAAIDAMATLAAGGLAGGGVVRAPFGTYIASQVQMKSLVTLEGSGDGTVFKQKAGANQDFFVLADTSVAQTTLSRLCIDGNSANQTSARGVAYINATSSGSVGRHRMLDIYVRNVAGDGVFISGTSAGTGDYRNIRVYLCDGYGFRLASHDNVVTNVDCGQSGLAGFRLEGSNDRLVGCNAWYSGRVNHGFGGFYLVGGSRDILVGCQAQDNQGDGFTLFNVTQCVLRGCISDSNNSTGNGTGSGQSAVGFTLSNATECDVDGIAFNRFGNKTMLYAVKLSGTTAATYGNRVHVTCGVMATGVLNDSNNLIFVNDVVLLGTTNGYSLGGQNDPFGLGFVSTFVPNQLPSAQALANANDGMFARVISGGAISSVGVNVTNSSGNISVGVYAGSGNGRNRVPGALLAASGAVACPVTGFATIALGSTIQVRPGDFLALSCDNTTATFSGLGGVTNGLFNGMSYRMATAHPLPSTASSLSATQARVPVLIGF